MPEIEIVVEELQNPLIKSSVYMNECPDYSPIILLHMGMYLLNGE